MGACGNAEEAKPGPQPTAPLILQRWPTTSTAAASASVTSLPTAKASTKEHVFSQDLAGYPLEYPADARTSPQYEYVDDLRLGKSTFSISLACLTSDQDCLDDSSAQPCPQAKQGQLDKVRSFACRLNSAQ